MITIFVQNQEEYDFIEKTVLQEYRDRIPFTSLDEISIKNTSESDINIHMLRACLKAGEFVKMFEKQED